MGGEGHGVRGQRVWRSRLKLLSKQWGPASPSGGQQFREGPGGVSRAWRVPNDPNRAVLPDYCSHKELTIHTYMTLNLIAIAPDFDGEFRKIAEKSSCDLQ